MIYRILQKLNNFSIKFTIFIVLLAIIINTIFKIYVSETKYYTEIKYFNIAIFIILVITLVNFIFTWTNYYRIQGKKGNNGDIGIEGEKGPDGLPAKCDLDCGSRVAYATIIKDINKNFNTLLKQNETYLKQLELEEDYAGYFKFKNNINPFNINYRNNYFNSELKQEKITEINVNSGYEFIFTTKDNNKILLKEGNYDKMALSRIDIEEDDIINGLIQTLEINTFINNDFLLNKINVLCHSNNYEEILRQVGKYETTEHKLITYLSKTINEWITDLVNFKINVKGETLFPGIIFLKKDNYTVEMFNNYKNDKGIPINNPFNEFKIDFDGETFVSDGPIKKYDIWRWDEVYSNSPLLIKKCFKNDNLPKGNEPKLSIIKTNSYEPLYNSVVNKDIYDTTACPFNQMGVDGTNPNNLKHCIYLETEDNPNFVKKLSPVWKRKECIPFQQQISIYQPRFNNGKYYYSDPVTKRKYYPVGCVWTGTADVNPPSTKNIFPSIGSSCSSNYNFGPQKETILVSGDVRLPIDYKLLWNSDEITAKTTNQTDDLKRAGVTIYSESEGNGESEDITIGIYNKSNIPGGTKFNPVSLFVKKNYSVKITLTIDSTDIPYNFEDASLHNIGYTDTNNIPTRFQFGFEPVNPTINVVGLQSEKDNFLVNNEKFITSYVIYSEQQTDMGTYYNALSFDEGVYLKPNIYNLFKANNGACAYFNKYDIQQSYKQQILQGYSQGSTLSKDSQYYACVLFRDYKFEQDQGKGQGGIKLISSDTRQDTLWLMEGEFSSDYIKKQGFADIVSSLIVLPGFEVTLSNSTGLKTKTFKAGYWPWVQQYGFTNDTMTSVKVKRVQNTITFGTNQCWTFIKVDGGQSNEYYIQSSWLPIWLAVDPENPIISKSTASKRFDKNFIIKHSIGIMPKEKRSKFLLHKLPNNKYTIQCVDYPGYYLWCSDGNYGLYKLGTFWDNISSMSIKYNPPTLISIENIQDNTYCKDDGEGLFMSCNTKKTNLNTDNDIIMELNKVENSVSFKGQNSNNYATMVDNHIKFSSSQKNTANTSFYLFNYNSDVNETSNLFYKINNSGEPIPLVIKYKIGNEYKSLGVASNQGFITFVSNFIFKIKVMSSDKELQSGMYSSISIWRPIPPAGYISLGDIAIRNIGGKLTKPEVFKTAPNMYIYEVNNNMGPPLVCVPESCVTKIANSELAWDNTKGGHVKIFNNYENFKDNKPSIIGKPDPCYLWVDGVTDALTENINRPLQNFNNDGGYNLFRCSKTKSPPTDINGLSYKLKKDCLRTIIPNVGFNYPEELDAFGDRPLYMKDNGYLPNYEHAYIESNAIPNEYNTENKSYYIQYVKDALPNNEQIDGTHRGEHVKGNKLYYINVDNPKENNFTNCLMMDRNEKGEYSIKTTECNFNDKRCLWRVKGSPGNNDILGFNPNNSDSENQNVNLMSYSNDDNKCIRQYYNPNGQNELSIEDCNWNLPSWKYKSLDISQL